MEPRHSKWKEYVEYKIARNKFHKFLGLEFVNIEPGLIEAELIFNENLEQQNGYLHGGVTFMPKDGWRKPESASIFQPAKYII